MTYFRMEEPHYHWRGAVSLSCSGWEGVGPARYGRQTNCQVARAVLQATVFVVARRAILHRATVSGRSKFWVFDRTASHAINNLRL